MCTGAVFWFWGHGCIFYRSTFFFLPLSCVLHLMRELVALLRVSIFHVCHCSGVVMNSVNCRLACPLTSFFCSQSAVCKLFSCLHVYVSAMPNTERGKGKPKLLWQHCCCHVLARAGIPAICVSVYYTGEKTGRQESRRIQKLNVLLTNTGTFRRWVSNEWLAAWESGTRAPAVLRWPFWGARGTVARRWGTHALVCYDTEFLPGQAQLFKKRVCNCAGGGPTAPSTWEAPRNQMTWNA